MKCLPRLPKSCSEIYRFLTLVSLVIILLTIPASAELGGSLPSVYRDGDYTHGSIQVTDKSNCLVFEISNSNGVIVREFVGQDGTVFAIAWEGHFIPDMSQFLGAYFDEYSAAAKTETRKYPGRGAFELHLPNFVFESGGHMGWYYGRAYIPQDVPKQTSVEEIH